MPTPRGRPPGQLQRATAFLREQIAAGTWRPGQIMPPERELCQRIGVARMTLRTALGALEADGMIEKLHGKGTAVAASARVPSHRRNALGILLNWAGEAWEDEAYVKQLTYGMQTALRDSGFSCTVHGKQAGERVIDFIRANDSIARNWGGLLVSSGAMDREGAAWLRDAGIPVVGLTSPPKGVEMSFVDVDNEAGGALAMRHLLDQGWRRPLFIDEFSASPYAQARRRGYRAALKEAGLHVENRFFVDSPLVRTPAAQETTAALIEPFLRRKGAIDSVIVYMEQPTIGVYRAMERRALRPGADLAVIHYNDYPWLCEVLRPRPTAVHHPFERVAHDATLMLQRRMRGELLTPEACLIQPELILRDSCPQK